MDTASESEFEMVSNTGVSSTGPSERDSGSEENQDTNDQGVVSSLRMQNQLLQNEITALHQEMKSLSERNIRSRTGMFPSCQYNNGTAGHLCCLASK